MIEELCVLKQSKLDYNDVGVQSDVPALIRTNSQKRGWPVNVFSVWEQTCMARETLLLDTGPNSFTEKSIFA